MKSKLAVLPLILLLLSPALSGQEVTEPADAVPEPEKLVTRGERLTFGDRMVIPENSIHRGTITSISGNLVVQGVVSGDVIVIGGEFSLSGKVEGEVVSVLADVELLENSKIEYGLVQVAGTLDDAGSHVGWHRVNIPLGLSLPGFQDPLGVLFSVFLWWMLLGLILMFLALLVLAALVPERIELLADEAPLRPFSTLLAGMAFSVLGLPLIYLLMLISVIGIPLLPFAFFMFLVLKWLGMAGFFLFFGRKLTGTVNRRISVLGGVLLGFLLFGVIKLVPVFGTALWLGFGWYGLGLILLTRAGSRRSNGISVPVRTAPAPAPATESVSEPAADTTGTPTAESAAPESGDPVV